MKKKRKRRALRVVPQVVLGSVFVSVVPTLAAGCGQARSPEHQSPVAMMMSPVAAMMPYDAMPVAPPPGVAAPAFASDAQSPVAQMPFASDAGPKRPKR